MWLPSSVTYLTYWYTPNPEHMLRLPGVWDKEEDCDVAKDMRFRNDKDLID